MNELWEDGEPIFYADLFNYFHRSYSRFCPWDCVRFFNNHGIISAEEAGWVPYKKASIEYFGKLKSLLNKCGYTPNVIRNYTIAKFLWALVGHPICELPRAIEEELVPRYINGQKYRNEVLFAQFSGYVIGLSRFFYTYDSGFSVRLVLSSQFSFCERRDFCIKNKKRLIVYVKDEIRKSKRIMKSIGSLDYFKCTEITVLRNPEVEFKFDIKTVVNGKEKFNE